MNEVFNLCRYGFSQSRRLEGSCCYQLLCLRSGQSSQVRRRAPVLLRAPASVIFGGVVLTLHMIMLAG